MLGTWGAERRRWKGGLRARIEALLAVFLGGNHRGAIVHGMQTSGSLGVKEPTFLELR